MHDCILEVSGGLMGQIMAQAQDDYGKIRFDVYSCKFYLHCLIAALDRLLLFLDLSSQHEGIFEQV